MALAGIESIETDPPLRTSVELALDELDCVYGFLYSRIGNRDDAEDLTQQVAMKAVPKLREGAHPAEIRAYLFATARTVLASFWEERARMPVYELRVDFAAPAHRSELVPPPRADASVTAILAELKPSYRTLLELRFLRGYSLREAAAEMGKTVGAVKVMQLRALREAARVLYPM